MRILVTIPHYFAPRPEGQHGSLRPDPRRLRAFCACLCALHEPFGPPQVFIDLARSEAFPANLSQAEDLTIVVCTTRERHLLSHLPLPPNLYTHHATRAEPTFLGFECHTVLQERLGTHDYYCYLEDDLIVHDPLFFTKLAWFRSLAGDESLLQPNRFAGTVGGHGTRKGSRLFCLSENAVAGHGRTG